MSGLLAGAAVVAVVFGWLGWRWISRPGRRPKFKDFRYSGSTYEESYENYQRALERWQQRTGRE